MFVIVERSEKSHIEYRVLKFLHKYTLTPIRPAPHTAFRGLRFQMKAGGFEPTLDSVERHYIFDSAVQTAVELP